MYFINSKLHSTERGKYPIHNGTVYLDTVNQDVHTLYVKVEQYLLITTLKLQLEAKRIVVLK